MKIHRKTPPSDFKDARNKYKAEYTELGWRIIEYKLMYYYPELVADKYHATLTIPDHEYDELEIRYLKICRKFKFRNTVVHKTYPGLDQDSIKWTGMLEVDLTRPAVHLVLNKYGVKNWKTLI